MTRHSESIKADERVGGQGFFDRKIESFESVIVVYLAFVFKQALEAKIKYIKMKRVREKIDDGAMHKVGIDGIGDSLAPAVGVANAA